MPRASHSAVAVDFRVVAPRRTIERILAAPPRQSLVLLLAALGAIATLFQNFFDFRFAGQLFHWPVLLGFAVLGAVFGISACMGLPCSSRRLEG